MLGVHLAALLYPQSMVSVDAKKPLSQQLYLVLYRSSAIPVLEIIRWIVEGEEVSFTKTELALHAFTC